MFDDSAVEIRYHALKMALDMTLINAEGNTERLNVSEVIGAAAKFEAFMAGMSNG